MKILIVLVSVLLIFASCATRNDNQKLEEPVFDSTQVGPLSDSVASLYRTQQ
jgi:uncharacterized lipoprotein YajG